MDGHPDALNGRATAGASTSATVLMIACGLLLSGCYLSSTIDDESGSGSRLRRVLIGPDDGEALFAYWHDEELDIDCRVMRAEDGQDRCLPFGLAGLFYENADCTGPVVEVMSCDTRRFVLRGSPSGARVLALDPTPVTLEAVYAGSPMGECERLDPPGSPLRRATRVDPSRFVAFSQVRSGETGSPIVVDRWVAEDGATQPGPMRDAARGTTCAVVPSAWNPNATPCLQSPAATRAGGASCADTWAVADGGDAPPAFAYSVEPGECGGPGAVHVYTVGARVTDAELATGARCGPLPLTGVAYHAELDDHAVPWFLASWQGSGRLQSAMMTDERGRELSRWWPLYRDTELDTMCAVEQTSDGLRCLPLSLGLAGGPFRFSDPACTQPATDRACATPFVTTVSLECPTLGITSVYRVGDAVENLYAQDASGDCTAVPVTGMARALVPVPLSTFVHFTRTVE
jgi:hypothetical protein